MVTHADIIILLNVFVKVNANQELFSLFHQEIAKRFDRVRHIRSEPRVWNNLRNKVDTYFQHGRGKDDANMGYFVHVVPKNMLQNRRVFQFNRYEGESVLGVPSNEWHLPAAEPILPGHTLVRPTLGMLKSAVTFPHMENEDSGASIYGNPKNLGIRYGGRSGRILYSNNRRMLSNNLGENPNTLDSTSGRLTSKYYVVPVTVDMVKDVGAKKLIHTILNKINYRPRSKYSSGHRFVDSTLRKIIIDGRDYGNPVVKKNNRRPPKTSLRTNKSKQHWMTSTMFDHIKLNSNKPELSELIPPDATEVSRNWWYFNEDDLSQLQETL